MNKHYPDNIAFRILFPIISGMILYLAMLTIFDSLDQLGEIFFSQEALFMVVLTYLNHELALLLIKRKIRNLVLYFTILMTSALLINSALTMAYFIYLLGYLHFRTELVTINILFILFHTMVNLYYLSIMHISRVRDISLQKEEDTEKQLELELESFKKEMNPELLIACLETLINLVHVDVKESEKYIQALSNQYRYILDRRHLEITELGQEAEAAGDLVYLLGYNVRKSMTLETNLEKGSRLQIIPGSLLFIVNWVFNNMIASPMRPIHIRIGLDEGQNVLVSYIKQPKIQGIPRQFMDLERLNRSYRHYTDSEIVAREGDKEMQWWIPRIPELDENKNAEL